MKERDLREKEKKKKALTLLSQFKASLFSPYEQHLLFPIIQSFMQNITLEQKETPFLVSEFDYQLSDLIRNYAIELTPRQERLMQKLRQLSFIKYRY